MDKSGIKGVEKEEQSKTQKLGKGKEENRDDDGPQELIQKEGAKRHLYRWRINWEESP